MKDVLEAVRDFRREIPLPASETVRRAHATVVARRTPRRVSRRTLAVAIAVVLAVAAVGTAVAVGTDLLRQQDAFHASLPDAPRPLGDSVEVFSGEGWAVIAWVSDHGLCIDFAVPGNSAFGCGLPVRGAPPGSAGELHSLAFLVAGHLPRRVAITGAVQEDVARVEVELPGGRVLRATPRPAPQGFEPDLRFFLVFADGPGPSLTRDVVTEFRTYRADGTLIERLDG